jgi:sRNA-binding carbon storage regulator CsrA
MLVISRRHDEAISAKSYLQIKVPYIPSFNNPYQITIAYPGSWFPAGRQALGSLP